MVMTETGLPGTDDGPREDARSFGPPAFLYDRVRPSYPHEAIKWALDPLGEGRHRVADIGAGTGILTRVVIAVGHDVAAVEPDEQMRERLQHTTPAAQVVAGSAEAMPLPDGAVD